MLLARASQQPDTEDGAGSASQKSAVLAPLDGRNQLLQQALVMASASAVLGPLCDGLHSSHDVLHYTAAGQPVYLGPVPLPGGAVWVLETCWWVPLLFGVAGVILGVAHPLLDERLPQFRPRGTNETTAAAATAVVAAAVSASAAEIRSPSSGGQGGTSATTPNTLTGRETPWPIVLTCIACFVAQYGASGALEQPLMGVTLPLSGGVPALDALLAAAAVATWAAFDATPQGGFMALLTAVAGPAVEVVLINGLHLYSYSHPDTPVGIPLWIAYVYACGGPAVGNLGRRVAQTLSASATATTTK